MNKVLIKYFTFRGDWYFQSWKNNSRFSGGLLVNIGIHFFDILIWIFGNLKTAKIKKKTESFAIGEIILEKAKVKWTVSIDKLTIKNSKIKSGFYRMMKVDNKIYNFDKFDDLHHLNYKEIIENKKFHISEFEKTINILSKLK